MWKFNRIKWRRLLKLFCLIKLIEKLFYLARKYVFLWKFEKLVRNMTKFRKKGLKSVFD